MKGIIVKKRRQTTTYWRRVSREIALIRQGYRCIYCLCNLTIDTATAEHIIPKSKGGNNKRTNLAASCKKCNNIRGDIDHDVFIKIVRKWNISKTNKYLASIDTKRNRDTIKSIKKRHGNSISGIKSYLKKKNLTLNENIISDWDVSWKIETIAAN